MISPVFLLTKRALLPTVYRCKRATKPPLLLWPITLFWAQRLGEKVLHPDRQPAHPAQPRGRGESFFCILLSVTSLFSYWENKAYWGKEHTGAGSFIAWFSFKTWGSAFSQEAVNWGHFLLRQCFDLSCSNLTSQSGILMKSSMIMLKQQQKENKS